MEDLSEIEFFDEKNESLKKEIINSFNLKEMIKKKLIKKLKKYEKIIREINENSNIQIIIKTKKK